MSMSHQRETATDRLSNVIQVIQLGRKSGLLTVERGTGITFEEGTITFTRGEAIEAHVGKYAGMEAFNWLNSWGPCLFAFIPAASIEMTSTARITTTGKLSDTTARLTAQKSVARGLLKPAIYGNEGGGVPHLREHSPTKPLTWTVPNRTRQIEEALNLIDQLGFSRAHRRLFLLIDGFRNTQELVRLSGRGQNEVRQLLNDLEQAGLIQS